MAEGDYYDILGVKKTATTEEIKTAFRKKARQNNFNYRRARNPETEGAVADQRMRTLLEARDVLVDDKKRAIYDACEYPGAAGIPAGDGLTDKQRAAEAFLRSLLGDEFFEQFNQALGGRRARSAAGTKSATTNKPPPPPINMDFQQPVGEKDEVVSFDYHPAPGTSAEPVPPRGTVQPVQYPEATGRVIPLRHHSRNPRPTPPRRSPGGSH